MWTTLCPNKWVWILWVSLDFASGSGFCQRVWIYQSVWIWKPHQPDSLLYHVIYTQPWHNCVDDWLVAMKVNYIIHLQLQSFCDCALHIHIEQEFVDIFVV